MFKISENTLLVTAVIIILLATGGAYLYFNSEAYLLSQETGEVSGYSKKYESNAGMEEMKINLSVSQGKITNLEISHIGDNSRSISYQTKFSEGINARVVGKKITDEFDKSTVNGASVTTTAFWEAFDEIKTQI